MHQYRKRVRGVISARNRPVTVEQASRLTASQSRAGRNLRAATLVGISLLALIFGSMLLSSYAFLAVCVLGALVALAELRGAAARANVEIAYPVCAVGALGILISAHNLGMEAALISFYAAISAGVVWHLVAATSARQTLRNIAGTSFVLGYVPLLLSFVVLLFQRGGIKAVTVFLLIVVANDTGGYIAGVLFGRHPMAPSISPKKSWEGFAGSLAGTLLISALGLLWLGGNVLWALPLGLLTAVTATTGDLSESLLKRDLGLKDMGSLLPGHGGIMDRLDSILVTAPAAFLLLLLALGW